MLPRKWMEAHVRFLLGCRWLVPAVSVAITVFLSYHLFSAKIQLHFLDIIPPNPSATQLARKHAHTRVFGSDSIMWSSDYPHTAATFPRSQEIVAKRFGHLPEGQWRKIVHDTAAKVYGLE